MQILELPEQQKKEMGRKLQHKEPNSKLSSNHVFHFTSKFDVLLKILNNGFRPNCNKESPIWRYEYNEKKNLLSMFEEEKNNSEDVDIPMVCFCDIPFKLINIHRKKYGSYGIALTKSWAKSKTISPVLYILKDTRTHTILNDITTLVQRIRTIPDYEEMGETHNLCNKLDNLLEFVKPYIDEKHIIKFYDEKEWRYVPPSMAPINPEDKNTYLHFEKEDIVQIIVNSKREKNIVLNFLQEKHGRFKPKMVKIKSIKCKIRS